MPITEKQKIVTMLVFMVMGFFASGFLGVLLVFILFMIAFIWDKKHRPKGGGANHE